MKRIVTIVAVLLLAGVTWAQPVPTQSGRELDVNPLIGSRGFNPSRPTGRSLNPNLYVYGQVTGGRAFHGSASAPPNELRLTLPSQSVDNFIRDSAGLPSRRSGPSYLSAPYVAPSRAVLNAQRIAAGQFGYTPTFLARSVISPVTANRLYLDATPDYQPLMPQSRGTMLRVDTPIMMINPNPPTAQPLKQAERPRFSTLFGVLAPEQSDKLSGELMANTVLAPPEGDEQTPSPAEPGTTGAPTEITPAVPENLLPQTPSFELPETPSESEPISLHPATLTAPSPGRDLFLDVMVKLVEKRASEDPNAERRILIPGLDPGVPLPRLTDVSEEDRTKVIIEKIGEAPRIVVSGLGGGQPDLFNRYLKQADELLRAGEFYKAASYYETALAIRRDNPLAAIGAGLSYLAAGEAMTSSYYFRRAMALFPPLMEIRFDLDKMVGQAVVNDRIKEFEDRMQVEGVQDPAVAFLLTFLYGSRGQDVQAKKWAVTLSDLKPEDKLMRAYASFVLTGVRPAEKEKAQAPPMR